jgi:hypothetical protein
MTEGSMGDRPYGGVNKRPDDEQNLPGERPEKDQVTAPPEPQMPRAAQGEMSEDVTRAPERGAISKPPGMPDPTAPQG